MFKKISVGAVAIVIVAVACFDWLWCTQSVRTQLRDTNVCAIRFFRQNHHSWKLLVYHYRR